ncbi:MAG: hypothetical protein CME25_19780 [Gemmatimonadetes bacterium]|nr:hypothetical protein [Gemmatimonadota bacterium]|tara:strand:+ start:10921 stop:11919 length:999 start_codon:yes stop_codon:yes gene_type:complete
MAAKRIAIIGAGNMARTRGRAFLETGQAEICSVSSRRMASAKACASELASDVYFDDYRRLAESNPDAILLEVPHKVQDEITLWALEAGFDLLIGGCLASNLGSGEQIAALAKTKGCVVEVGYQRRYDPAWKKIKQLVESKELGIPVMSTSMALWNADPEKWYYDQETSGGMPLTHMSYCYLNAIRWILGKPIWVSAVANKLVETGPTRVLEESCGAHITFENGSFLSATASYVGPEGMSSAETRFVFTDGGIQTNDDNLSIKIFRGGEDEIRAFCKTPSPFVRQARAFLEAVESRGNGQNPPDDAILDNRIAECISCSVREQRAILVYEEKC